MKSKTRQIIINALRELGPMTIHEIAEETGLPVRKVSRQICATRHMHPGKYFRVVRYQPLVGRTGKDLRVYAAEEGPDVPNKVDEAARLKARQARYRNKHRAVINARNRVRNANQAGRYVASSPWMGLMEIAPRARK